MIETWRWFGPSDPISLADVAQTGATGIVTALHHIPLGEAWPLEEIAARRAMIAAAGLTWEVVESIPVTDAMMTRTGDYKAEIANWCTTLERLGTAGVPVVCYNVMPVVDWTRTVLEWQMPTGATALRFALAELAAYDVYVLQRPGAEGSYPQAVLDEARIIVDTADDEAVARLEKTIIAGLPGTDVSFTRDSFLERIALYDGITRDQYIANYTAFLEEVVPVAEANGIRLAVHPDDPPFEIFGLPRIVSTKDDVMRLLSAVDHHANGITLCAGSYGSRADNDVLAIAESAAERIHFVHLRNVTVEGDRTFHEANHLDGRVDMVRLIGLLMAEEQRRADEGRGDLRIPMRPDHGHKIGPDFAADTNPGYPYVGRLRGLAELRGIARTLEIAQSV